MSKDNSSYSSSSSSSSSLSNIRSSLTEEQKQELDDKLIRTAKTGDLKTIKKLFQQGADVNAVNDEGRTALHKASRFERAEIVQFLIDNGANVNAVNDEGRTALHKASNFEQIEIIQLLIDNGADVNVVDDDGETALYWPSRYRDTKTAILLLQNGANVYIASQDLRYISELVSPLKKAHEDLKAICLRDGNNKGEAVLDGKINRIRSELLVNYPNLINSPLDAKGNTILNLIANEIVSKETGEEKDDLLRLFVKLALINSSEFKRNVTANIGAEITADYSTDNKKGAINPIGEMLVINNSLERNLILDVNEMVLGFLKGNERDQNLIQAFFLAEEKNYWQDALTHSQSSIPYLGQNTNNANVSSSSSSSFTAGSSNNKAARSGKDEEKYPDNNLTASSSAAAAKGSSSSSTSPATIQENRDLQTAINASLQDLERQPSSSPSNPEGKGASGNKGGRGN